MPIRGQTGTMTSLDLKTSVEVRPAEFSLIPKGKIVINLPGLRIRLSQINITLLFLPILGIGSMEMSTEPAKLEVDLSDTTIQTRLEKVAQLQVTARGEIRASATLEGNTAVTTGPLRLEV
ncbi:MAG: hypothetical protein ACK4WF_07360 [Candidatus Brocadiales bacterium]